MYQSSIKGMRAICAMSATVIILSSCQKNGDAAVATASAASTIAVPATLSVATGVSTNAADDSVYVMQDCRRGGKRDSIVQSALPQAAQNYLSANYSGYTFHKAFAINNASGSIAGYVAIVYYNTKPVAVEFNSWGNFVRVLEQREKGDLGGRGHHGGGRFEHRDGKGRDTIALTALPSSISAYFAANYSADTLVKAFTNRDSSVVVLSKNNGAFATVFNASGVFVSRSVLQTKSGRCETIELSALPSIAANYLAQIYPNYVFNKAFAIIPGSAVKGFIVVIDANNTRYAVEFDASGNYVSAKTIR